MAEKMVDKCPECKGKVKIMSSEITCIKCGLVVEQRMY